MAVLQATSITGGLTMHGMAAGFVKLNASGAVMMDTNTYATESSLSSYLPLSGGTINGNLTMSGAGNSTSIIFGEGTKRINVEGYWMMFKGHENEGFRWQTAGQDNVTYTTRMQLTSSALTVNGNTVWHAGNLTNLNQLSNGPGYITQTNALQPIYNNSGAFNLNTSGQHAWVRYSEGAWVNSPVSGNYSHVLSFNLAPDNRTVQVYFGDVPGYLWWRPFQGNSVIHPWERILTSNNYNSWAPTLTGGGASGTWGIDVTGNSATTSQRSFSGDISTGGMGRFTGWYNGTAATGLASEVGISSGEGYVIVYNRNSGSYGSLNLNAVNIKIDPQGGSATVSGSQIVTNNGGTWSINVTGSAGSASVASSVPWTGVSAGIRSNYDLQFRPPDNVGSYGGIAFATAGNSFDAGYFLVRGGPDSDVYTQNGITLVADTGWLTLAQRTRSDRGVRIMTGATSTSRLQIDSSGNTDIGLGAGTVTLYHGGSARFWTGSDGTRTQGWSYFQNTGQGLHWPGNQWHLMPASASDFRIHSGSNTDSALRFETNGTTRGYVYAENDNTIGFLTNSRNWAFRTYSNGNALVYGYLTVNGAGTSSSIYMNDSDEGQREIHCNSNRIGFLTQAGSWGAWLYDGADWEAASSVRAPIFYDSNNTGYYGDFASFSYLNQLGVADWQYIGGQTSNGQSNYQWDGATYRNPGDWTARLIIRRDNASTGINGSMPSLVLFNNNGGDQTTVSMVFATNECITGSNSVNLAGIIAKKEAAGSCGGWSPGSLTFFVKDYGARRDALTISTAGNLSTPYTMYAAAYRGNANVGGTGEATYHPAGIYSTGTNWLYGTMYLNNNTIHDASNIYNSGWYRNYGQTGLYNQTYDNHIASYDTSYWRIASANGIQIYDKGIVNLKGYIYFDSSGFGLLNNQGGWSVLAYQGSSYGGELRGAWTATGDMRAPIFYDSNDTGYYLDPNSTSNSALRIRGGTLHGPNPTWGKYLYVGTNGRPGGDASVAVTNGNLHIDCENGYALYLNWYSNNNIYTQGNMAVGSDVASHRLHVHGTGLATSDFRAPIFYDSANTSYYCDPASTSVLNTISSYTIYNTSLGSGYYFTAGSWGWRHQTPSGYIEFGPANSGHAHIYTDRSNFYFNVDVLYMNGNRVYGDNYRPYADSAGNADTVDGYHATFSGNANTIPVRNASGYLEPNNWIQFNGSYGIYDPTNSAHLLRNNHSYGSWKITGERNGWRGLHFGEGSGITLMMNEGEFGFHRESVGWVARFTSGRGYFDISGHASTASNITDFFINQSLGTGSGPTFAQVYTSGWFRNYGNQGIYNQDYGVHFYAQGSTAWSITGSGGNIELQFRSNHNSTVRGYVYANTSNEIGFLRNDGNWALRCDPSSNVFGHNNLYAYYDVIAYYSDERLKTKTGKIDNALTKIMSLEGFSYVHNDLAVSVGYTDNKKQQIGLSAQEVQKIAPELVTLAAFDVAFDENGNEYSKSGENYLTIKYDRLVPILVEAIKEQQKQIEELKAKLN